MGGEVGNKANTAPVAVGVKVGAELGNIYLHGDIWSGNRDIYRSDRGSNQKENFSSYNRF